MTTNATKATKATATKSTPKALADLDAMTLAAPSAFIPDIEKASSALRAVYGLLAENAFQDEGQGRLDDVTEHGLACCVGLAADYLDGVMQEMREASPKRQPAGGERS